MGSFEQLISFENTEMKQTPAPLPWPELTEEPLPRFPSQLLPDICARLVEAVAASFPVPVDYAACALLGAANAALVGRVAVQPRKDHREAIQLFLCLGGESGTNKTGPMRLFMKPLEAWLTEQNREILRRNRQREARRTEIDRQLKARSLTPERRAELLQRREAIEDEPEFERILSDATPEAMAQRMKKQGGSCILYTDEGGIVNTLAGMTYGRQGGAANLDTVLKGFDGGSIFVDRVGTESVDIERANLSMTIGMQPSLIQRMTGNADLADRGFPQRALFFLPDNLVNVRVSGLPDVPDELLVGWKRLLQTLSAIHRGKTAPALLSMTRGAQKVFTDHRQDMMDRTLSDMGGSLSIRAWARKAAGKTARLAGMLALLEDPATNIIEEAHVRAAVAMMNDYFIPHMKRAFGGSSDLSADALLMVDRLRSVSGGEISQGDLLHRVSGQKKYKGEAGNARFQEVVRELSAAGYIRLTDGQQGGRGRRRGPVLLVHPALYQQKTAVPVEEGTL